MNKTQQLRDLGQSLWLDNITRKMLDDGSLRRTIIERRIAAGLDPQIGSVASLFVSRWDKAVSDKVPADLRNRLGIAIGQRCGARRSSGRAGPSRRGSTTFSTPMSPT